MLTMGVLGTLFDIFTGQALWKGIWAIIDALFLVIDSMVYAVINYMYSIFTLLAGARVLDANTLTDMANRVYIFIGVVALFLVAYALLTAIIDPDKASKGDNSLGKVIPNVALAIVGIAIVPTIFTYAYRVQKAILCENIIPKWLVEENYENIDSTNENAGATLATELFQSFFIPKDSNMDGYQAAVNSAREGDSFISAFGPLLGDVVDGNITYLIIISTVAGLFCAYVLLGYCLDAGLRAVKLAYLQLLAPLPILLTIIPGQKKVFKNWLSKTVSCFLEVFVRIFAMAFAIYIINHLPNLLENNQLFEGACATQPGIITILLIKAIIICALFDFMKQAPKLISEITGIDSKGFGIGLKGKGILGDAFGTLGGIATGAATGALGAGWSSAMNTKGGLKNRLASFSAGAKFGAANGAKKGGNQLNAMRAQHYTDVLHGKGKAGVFGGQAYIDSKADAARKATQKSYNKAVEDRVTTAPEFISKMNELLGGKYQIYKANADSQKEIYNSAQAAYDTDGKDALRNIRNFETSEEYKNALINNNDAAIKAVDEEFKQKINNKEYGNDPYSNPKYYRDRNARFEKLLESKVLEDLNNQKRSGTASQATVDYLNNIEKYNELVDNVNNSKASYTAAQDTLDTAKNNTLEYFANLDTTDARLTSLKNDADFTIKRRNEKIADDYVKSVEGQKEVAARVEAEKTIGKPNSGQGTAKAPGDGKAGGSK